MEKILIIETNKSISRIIKEKISQTFDFKVDVVSSKEEAKFLIESNEKRSLLNLDNEKKDYFLSIVSYKILNEPDGLSLNYVLSENIPSIVLVDNISNKTIKTINNMDIIDYTIKDKLDDILYIIYTIERIHKNRHYKALICGDSLIYRTRLRKLLNAQLIKTFETDNPNNVLDIINLNKDIKILFVDNELYGINGIQLIEQVRFNKTKEDLIIVSVNSSEKNLSSQFLKFGANDYMNNNFTKEEFNSRINNLIENFENIEKMKNFAYKDFLTGLYNRRYFFEEVEKFLDNSKNFRNDFSITMIDIDNFKKVNDTFGHDMGDEVIKSVSKILKDNTKNSDILSRFGGEEFCLLLKNINEENNLSLLEKIRKQIEENLIYTSNNLEIKYTVSIGTVSVKDNKSFSSINELIKESDENLYHSKTNGKNQITNS